MRRASLQQEGRGQAMWRRCSRQPFSGGTTGNSVLLRQQADTERLWVRQHHQVVTLRSTAAGGRKDSRRAALTHVRRDAHPRRILVHGQLVNGHSAGQRLNAVGDAAGGGRDGLLRRSHVARLRQPGR